jgi:hypothetical protein
MSKMIWTLLTAVLDFSAKRFGVGSSHELCRDLRGRYQS